MSFSPRIRTLIAAGRTNAEIAAMLGCTHGLIRVVRHNLQRDEAVAGRADKPDTPESGAAGPAAYGEHGTADAEAAKMDEPPDRMIATPTDAPVPPRANMPARPVALSPEPSTLAHASLDDGNEAGTCQFIAGDPRGDAAKCGARAKAGSSYCALHHAQCHLARHSIAERRAIRSIELMAEKARRRFGGPATR